MWIPEKGRIDVPDGSRPYKPLVVPVAGATPFRRRVLMKTENPVCERGYVWLGLWLVG